MGLQFVNQSFEKICEKNKKWATILKGALSFILDSRITSNVEHPLTIHIVVRFLLICIHSGMYFVTNTHAFLHRRLNCLRLISELVILIVYLIQSYESY